MWLALSGLQPWLSLDDTLHDADVSSGADNRSLHITTTTQSQRRSVVSRRQELLLWDSQKLPDLDYLAVVRALVASRPPSRSQS